MISIKNASKYLIIATALKRTYFVVPIIMLFYGFKGVSIGDFYLIQGIFLFAAFFFEIPTGYIGDLFSRKKTVILGFLGGIVGYSIWIFGYGFWALLAGELVLAFAYAFISGTIEAYLYDLLKKNHTQKKFHKKLSRFNALSDFGLMIACFSGAFLYQFISPLAPLYFTVALSVIGCIILFFLPDVPEAKRQVQPDKSKWQDIMDISKTAVKDPQIKWLMVFPALYGTMTLILMWGLQSVMIAREVPVFLFSIILGLNGLIRFCWSSIAGKLMDKISLTKIIIILLLIIFISSFGAAASMYVPNYGVYICLFLMMLGSGSVVLAGIVTSTLVNHRINSDERATVLSVKSMIGKFFIGIGMISLKPLFDTVGVGETYIISCILLFPIFTSAYMLYKKM